MFNFENSTPRSPCYQIRNWKLLSLQNISKKGWISVQRCTTSMRGNTWGGGGRCSVLKTILQGAAAIKYATESSWVSKTFLKQLGYQFKDALLAREETPGGRGEGGVEDVQFENSTARSPQERTKMFNYFARGLHHGTSSEARRFTILLYIDMIRKVENRKKKTIREGALHFLMKTSRD